VRSPARRSTGLHFSRPSASPGTCFFAALAAVTAKPIDSSRVPRPARRLAERLASAKPLSFPWIWPSRPY
jgi:hypothetical protein